ncbi:MAG: glycosyltransferase [Spirochaetaceae bacterium]|jgi:glycosyltransferase involved in cell wall biosynthesis|nr:glycosyltransferase [Spirochaetaceae bacterium]
MKIVMFTDSYWPRVNGVTVSVEAFANTLLKRGHDVLIVCPLYPGYTGTEAFSLNTEKKDHAIPESCILRVPSIPLMLSQEDRLTKSHKLFWVKRKIDTFAPDIIHVHSEFVMADFGFFCARVRKIPAIYTFHTLWEEYMKNYVPYVPVFILNFLLKIILGTSLKRAFRIIVPGQETLEVAQKYKIKREPYLLPTGINPDIFTHSEEEIAIFKRKMEIKYPKIVDKNILLYAGRIGKEKNIEFLVKIAPKILKKHSNVIFLIVGNGPDLYGFQDACEEAGVLNDFIFTGYMDRKDLALTYAISKIFVFPSLTETQGLVTIESMTCGIPVVAIGARGTLTVMAGDNGGFMVKNDAEEFSKRVFDLLEDQELYKKKSAEAKEYSKKWTIDIMTDRLEKIYADAIGDYKKKATRKRLF